MQELGWVEGRTLPNLACIGQRYRARQLDELVPLAVELVQQKVDVIVAVGTLASLAARQATTTIPIVMAAARMLSGSDLVANLAQPGGNVTGVTLDVVDQDLDAKRLELLKEALPEGVPPCGHYTLGNEDSSIHQRQISRMEAVAPTLGIELRLVALGASRRGPGARLRADAPGPCRSAPSPVRSRHAISGAVGSRSWRSSIASQRCVICAYTWRRAA